MNKSNKHIAVITYGGIKTGVDSLSAGIPIILSFVDHLSKRYQVTVFSLNPINPDSKKETYDLVAPNKKGSFVYRFSWILKAFFKEQKKNKFDLIHAFWGHPQGFFSIVLKYMYRIPVIIHLQGGDSTFNKQINYGVFGSWIKRQMINWAYSKASELIVLTEYQQKELKRYVKKRDSKVVTYGIVPADFKFKELTLKAPLKFIHIGHISPVKDQKILLEAFKIVSEFIDSRLILLGSDTMFGALQKYAESLGINQRVHFEGQVSMEEVKKHLGNSHIMLHTSIYEAQAVVVNEALASGVVVCGTHVGLIADLSNYCTISSPVGKAGVLAEKVIQLLKNEAHYKELVKKGYHWSVENDHELAMGRIYQIYSQYI